MISPNKIYFSLCYLILNLFLSLPNFGQVIIWNGAGDGQNWEDPNNWNLNAVPDQNSMVLINSGNIVKINTNGARATSIAIGNNSTLNIAADINIDNQFTSHGIILTNTGNLMIQEDVTVFITSTDFYAIYVESGTGTVDNAGTILTGDIGFPGSSDGFIIRLDTDSKINFTNQATGVIRSQGVVETDFILIPMDASDNSSFINRGLIDLSQLIFDGIHLYTNMTFDNYGTIQIDSIGEYGFIIDTGVVVINHPTGNIQLGDIGQTSINLNGTSKFTNDGTINIQQQAGGFFNSAEGIDLDGKDSQFINNGTISIAETEASESVDIGGVFTNNGLMTIGVGLTGDEAIGVNADGKLTNSACGIINIITPDSIDNDLGIIDNQGIITSIFQQMNTNTGTFTNTGILSTPTSNFLVSGNPIIGNGSISAEPIPAELAICNFPAPAEPIPTISEWGLLIFALLLLNLGVMMIAYKEKLLAEIVMNEQKE